MDINRAVNWFFLLTLGLGSVFLAVIFKLRFEYVLLMQGCWFVPALILFLKRNVILSLSALAITIIAAILTVYIFDRISLSKVHGLTYVLLMYTSAFELIVQKQTKGLNGITRG
jgi:hypothetical protein